MISQGTGNGIGGSSVVSVWPRLGMTEGCSHLTNVCSLASLEQTAGLMASERTSSPCKVLENHSQHEPGPFLAVSEEEPRSERVNEPVGPRGATFGLGMRPSAGL